MIKHLVEIENYNSACEKCKYQIKSKHGYLCGIFKKPLPTELSNKYNCRCDDCLSLGYAYDGEEVISKKLQKFIATQTTELKAQAIVWHEYPDEIPAEAGVKCLVMFDDGELIVTTHTGLLWYDIEKNWLDRITHWAYLPEPPKEEK